MVEIESYICAIFLPFRSRIPLFLSEVTLRHSQSLQYR